MDNFWLYVIMLIQVNTKKNTSPRDRGYFNE